MKVLIVVDMQNDFIDGSLGTKEAQAIVPLVCETIEQMADSKTALIFTRDTHLANYMDTLEGKNLPVPHCIKDTKGYEINGDVFGAYVHTLCDWFNIGSIYPLCDGGTLFIDKPTFGSVDLQNALYAMDNVEPVEEITLMGLCTDICVLSNAILAKATLPEVPVNVVADCCAGVTPESHTNALNAMKMCQINII